MRLEDITWLEKEQDEKGTTYTYVLVEATRYKVIRRVGYLLDGRFALFEGKHLLSAFKTEEELLSYIKKYVLNR